MLSRRSWRTAAQLSRAAQRPAKLPSASFTSARSLRADPEIDDPEMNGGYVNPPAIKRQHRDPYGDWWDKQERRNFGEPVHEDNDLLARLSLHEYTHMSPARAFVMWGGFISIVVGLYYAVALTAPPKPSLPKEYEGGLERELGGPGAVRARMSGDEV